MAVLGCIADDFTGASDGASFLAKGGMKVLLLNGIPEEGEVEGIKEAQAIVIALKSRTQKKEEAVRDSLHAARFLLGQGVRQIYFKYCSTFDSTPKGNIGPVADSLMELLNVPYTLLCPALPVNGRIVKDGRLFVNGIPLNESHMKDHPLTPMWDSRISCLMEPQSRYRCNKTEGEPYYLIPDYKDDEDGRLIAEQFGELPLLTGGSGLLEPLGKRWAKKLGACASIPESGTEGRAILLAGSCSKATLEQIAWYKAQGFPAIKLDPEQLLAGSQTLEQVWEVVKAQENCGKTVLVYSSDVPEQVKRYQELGAERVSAILEKGAACLALWALQDGYTRIISAGGETSGAVTRKLGFQSFWIGESVAPGVPVMIPAEAPEVRLVLKSGNFGQEDFFGRALAVTGDGLKQEKKAAIWAAHSLFERGKTAGSSANMSFRFGDRIYVSASGSCFGTLKEDDFGVMDLDGNHLGGKKPSKEWPLHLAFYKKSPSIGAVIHTHSTYSVLWSFLPAQDERDCIPEHTPYLKMKLGTVGLVPYEKPGSEALFAAFRERVDGSDGFLLKNHGPVVPGKDIMDAFYCLEELEESARIAWELHRSTL